MSTKNLTLAKGQGYASKHSLFSLVYPDIKVSTFENIVAKELNTVIKHFPVLSRLSILFDTYFILFANALTLSRTTNFRLFQTNSLQIISYLMKMAESSPNG